MLPHVSWPDLVPLDTQIAPRETHHVNGNISGFELEVITRLVKHHQPMNLFEIGTFDGRTTLNMAAHAVPDARVFTLDLPPIGEQAAALQLEVGDRLFINKQRSGGRFAGSDLAHKIIQLYGDSGNFDFSPWYEKMDFIFVDGHSYEYVLSDSQVAMMMARPDAVILWHDYVSEGPTPWPGVRRALQEMQKTDERFRGCGRSRVRQSCTCRC
jgi:predicted O-methyltransferase YrrM